MKKRNYKFYIRKSHRYLGIFIGIQFLLWTLGGLYFSWTNIKEIRGDNLRKEGVHLDFGKDFVSPKIVVARIVENNDVTMIHNLRLIHISGSPFYEFAVVDRNKTEKFIVADAVNGKIQGEISKEEAEKIAVESLITPQKVQETIYLTKENVGGHHEYREKPLPAWAVTFEDNLTVYLSAQNGQIGAFRTVNWRVFDFLWMLHTMDYQNRDDINNYFLRGFSILGIVTILSGFMLFFISSKFPRRFLLKR